MIAMPIPTDETVPPIVRILFAIAAGAGFIVLLVQAVRWWRRDKDDDHHDVFGPPSAD